MRDELARRLHPMAGPFLFVGSGISRRYAKLPDWEGLLAHFADETGRPLDYYRGAAANDLPRTASLIADEFYDVWWRRRKYANSVRRWSGTVTDHASVLKIEAAQYIKATTPLAKLNTTERREFEAFQRTVVDGVITTNFDDVLNRVFPTFASYIGQDELLLSNTFGIAEIYMIHGSAEDPASLVLTDADYRDFNARNAYLAAKLMTVFVEHPVIFLGYSLSDSNIRAILSSLVAGLRGRTLHALQDKLIVVEWDPAARPALTDSFIQIDSFDIPVVRLVVPDFLELFEVLGQRVRALPARVLRVLKEQVFELVKSGDPSNRLYATTDIDAKPTEPIDIVFGVGAKRTTVGVVGLSRGDIIDDLLEDPSRDIPAASLVDKVIAKVPVRNYMPVFKYLREAGMLDNGGQLIADVPTKIAERVGLYGGKLMVASTSAGTRRKVSSLEADLGWEGVLNLGLEIVGSTSDLKGVREFLCRHRDKRDRSWWSTQYAKVAVAYDWMAYATTRASR